MYSYFLLFWHHISKSYFSVGRFIFPVTSMRPLLQDLSQISRDLSLALAAAPLPDLGVKE